MKRTKLVALIFAGAMACAAAITGCSSTDDGSGGNGGESNSPDASAGGADNGGANAGGNPTGGNDTGGVSGNEDIDAGLDASLDDGGDGGDAQASGGTDQGGASGDGGTGGDGGVSGNGGSGGSGGNGGVGGTGGVSGNGGSGGSGGNGGVGGTGGVSGNGGSGGSGGNGGVGGTGGTGGSGGTGDGSLSVSVTLNPDRVRPGEGLRAKMIVTNRGASTLLNTVLQARFPTDGVNNSLIQTMLTGGGTCPGSYCDRGELATWQLGSLGAGQSIEVSMPMVVATGTVAGAVISVPAEVNANGMQALASASVTVDTDNALSLALDEDTDAVAPGGTLSYTLTYGNRSTASVTGTTLSLPLPAGVDFVSASNGGTLVGNTVQWTLGTLQASQSGRQQVVVTAKSGLDDGTTLAVNAAELSGTSAVTGPELARATAATRVETTPVLGLAIEMDPDPVRPGEGVRAKLTVTNRSATALLGAVLQARFPTDRVNDSLIQTMLTSGGTCPGSYCDRYELANWNLGTIAAGAGVTVMMPMAVTAGTAAGTLITLDAVVTANSVSSGSASHTVVVDADNALSLSLNEDMDAVAPGGTLSYTLTYGNRSTASVTGTTLSLPLPTGVDFVSAPNGGTLVGNTVQWTLGTLQASQSGRRQVIVTAKSGLSDGTLLAIDAELSGTSAVTGPELARATAATRVGTAPVLGLAIEMDPDPVRPGEGVRAKLTVTNRSATALLGAVLQARFPTDRVNDSLIQTMLTSGGTCPGSYCDRYELANWNLGTIAAGAGVTVMMPMAVTDGVASGTLITLDAVVTANSVSSGSASHTVVVDADNALSLSLNEDTDVVAPSGTLNYTLTYGNRSTASVTGTTLSLPLPAGVDFVSASNGGTLGGNTVQWTLGTLQASQLGRQQVIVTAKSGLNDGTILAVDAAELSGTSAVTGPELARATAATHVLSNSPILLSVSVSPNPIGAAQTLLATLTVTNRGASNLMGVVLQARFPTDRVNNSLIQTMLTGGGTCPGSYCDRYELANWNIGTIAAGASVTVMMPMVVTAGTVSGTLITVDGQVRPDAGDQAIASDTAAVGTGSF